VDLHFSGGLLKIKGMLRTIFSKLNIFVLAGAVIITIGLFLMWSLISRSAGAGDNGGVQPTAILAIIKAPTITPSLAPSLTPDVAATQQALKEAGQIYIGGYVEISGTEGAGLRLRADPGLDKSLLSLGYDSEVYKVEDGPKEADGITWWYLVAPYDNSRCGWAASNFLAVVTSGE